MRALALLLLGLTAAVTVAAGQSKPLTRGADCSKTSVGFTPLTDLKAGRYQSFEGGLYPGGKNAPSTSYLKKGLAYAKLVKPRDAAGKAAAGGKIVLLSVGMSNTTQEFSEFVREAAGAPRNPALTIVDGAQGGQDAEIVKNPSARYWNVVDQRLAAAGATPAQVQAVWLKEAIARPTETFPADANRLQSVLRDIVTLMRARFPNLRLVYLSSRTYAGYATTTLNPEPYAYQSGFAVKWLVQQRIQGSLSGRPWIGWGPYLWTNGTHGRSDGLVWTCQDVIADGTHPSPSGRQKVAQLLLKFFATNATAKRWFP
jgi:hypothetical protein